MGWLEVKDRYQQQGNPEAQKVEDPVARRVLQGLGFVERQLRQLEYLNIGQVGQDLPLWERVKPLMCMAFNNTSAANVLTICHYDVFKIRNDKDVIERLKEDPRPIVETGVRPVIFAKVGDTSFCNAYALWRRDEIGEYVHPPYAALCEINNSLLIMQDLKWFVEQYGPYDRILSWNETEKN